MFSIFTAIGTSSCLISNRPTYLHLFTCVNLSDMVWVKGLDPGRTTWSVWTVNFIVITHLHCWEPQKEDQTQSTFVCIWMEYYKFSKLKFTLCLDTQINVKYDCQHQFPSGHSSPLLSLNFFLHMVSFQFVDTTLLPFPAAFDLIAPYFS